MSKKWIADRTGLSQDFVDKYLASSGEPEPEYRTGTDGKKRKAKRKPKKEREPGSDDKEEASHNGKPVFSIKAFNECLSRAKAELDKLAHSFGLERQARRPGMAASVVETPEQQGIVRILEEAKEATRKWLEQLKKQAKEAV